MTRSFKALFGAVILAECVLPTMASAQDTGNTGGRVMRDGAGAGWVMMIRFDSAQTVTMTGVTIGRVDMLPGRASADMGGMHEGLRGMGEDGAGVTATRAMRASGGALPSVALTEDRDTAATPSAVRTGSDSLHVRVVPSSYLIAQALTLNLGDVADLTGMRVTPGDQKNDRGDRDHHGDDDGAAAEHVDWCAKLVQAGWHEPHHGRRHDGHAVPSRSAAGFRVDDAPHSAHGLVSRQQHDEACLSVRSAWRAAREVQHLKIMRVLR